MKRNDEKEPGIPGSRLWHLRRLPRVLRQHATPRHVDPITLGTMSGEWLGETWTRQSKH